MNEEYDSVEGAYASCWVRENDAQGAYTKASFFIEKGDWNIDSVENEPIAVTAKDFAERDLGLKHFLEAQENDISIFYNGWARDGKSSYSRLNLKSSYKFDLGNYLQTQKKLFNTKRCLHYDSGNKCNKIIKAHSIQKSRSLSLIADKDQNVYKLTADMSTLRETKGTPSYKKRSINKPFTFLGFCKKHDNELFEPIDNIALIPTDEQVFLYAYRSLCREYFVKENSFNLFSTHKIKTTAPNIMKDYFKGMDKGVSFGFNNLKRHKKEYDDSLRNKSFHNINYVLFSTKEKPIVAFSGLFYPDFDFMGRQLQNLADHNKKLDLITFCSAPLNDGWGYLFAWHDTSNRMCEEFMRSLATKMYEGKDLGTMLFRLIIAYSENHAISPKWWESLKHSQVQSITEKSSWMTSPFCTIKPSFIQEGLENIVKWNFHSVLSTMEETQVANQFQ